VTAASAAAAAISSIDVLYYTTIYSTTSNASTNISVSIISLASYGSLIPAIDQIFHIDGANHSRMNESSVSRRHK
jgi:hypothetical protein